MRKCHDCGETKNLKCGWVDDDIDGMKDCCFCKQCFFDNEYENESEVTRENWDHYDYHWNLKKKYRMTVEEECNST